MKGLQKRFNQLWKSLIDDKIIGVTYYLYKNSVYDQYKSPFHHTNSGFDLEMESCRNMGISWNRQFATFNLNVLDRSLGYDLRTSKILLIDMTHHPSWHPIIAMPIRKVETYWSRITTTSGQKSEETSQYYPQDTQIVFDKGLNLYISASLYLIECDCFLPAMDNISIFFDEDIAKRYLPSFIDNDVSEI